MATILRVMAAAFVTVSRGAEIKECTFSDGKLGLSWTSESPADYYEVQVANEAGGSIFAVFSTAQKSAKLDFLNANTSYWLKVRAHNVGMPSLGPGTWAKPGSELECKTGSHVAKRIDPRATSLKTTLLEVLRESEFTYDVDYLMNHDSGDIMGDTAFLVFTAHQPDQPGFLNVTFRKSVFTLYCVERLVVTVPHTITTYGDANFADYLSCNDNNNATDPRCSCDNSIDREIAKTSNHDTRLTKYCHNPLTGAPCNHSESATAPSKPSAPQEAPTRRPQKCTCTCSNTSLAASAKYTGMTPVHFHQSEPIGHWYSHPKDTECTESEAVGTVRADGTLCTWKRHQEARVVRGGDALAFGWNISGHVGHRVPADPVQIRQNAALLRKLFDSKPYQQWTCSDASNDVTATGTIVV